MEPIHTLASGLNSLVWVSFTTSHMALSLDQKHKLILCQLSRKEGYHPQTPLPSTTLTPAHNTTPPSYRINKACHPSSQFSLHIKYNGAMVLGIYRNKRGPTTKPFPPGTRVSLLQEGVIQSATVEHLPLIPYGGSIPQANPPYLIRFYDVTITKREYEYLR